MSGGALHGLTALVATSDPSDWRAVGHRLESAWIELAARGGSWLLGGLLIALIVSAWLRRHRYRAVAVLDENARGRVEEELARAETQTTGEIVVAVVERSDRHPQARLAGALIAAALGTALLPGLLPLHHPALLLPIQAGFALIGFLLATWLPDVQHMLVSDDRATEMAEEQALLEFNRLEMQQTSGRTGVLLFVSLLEHRVVVLADEGIHQRVGEDAWVEVDQSILEGIRHDSLQAGLTAGIQRASAVLAEHLPSDDGGENERPDQLIIRRE